MTASAEWDHPDYDDGHFAASGAVDCVAEVDDIYMIFQRDFAVWQGFGGFAIGFRLEIHKTYQIGRFL